MASPGRGSRTRGAHLTGTARVAVNSPGRIAVDVDAPGPRILALAERFHDGWTASADGRPLRMSVVEGDFLGAAIDAGAHRVEFRFMPRGFVIGAVGSLVGVVLLVGAVLFLRQPNPRGL